jgi:hypothetical protein
LAIQGDDLVQTATGRDDTGGDLFLWASNDGISGWAVLLFAEWDSPYYWGSTEGYSGLYLKATESGNGTAYLAMPGPFSEVLHVP